MSLASASGQMPVPKGRHAEPLEKYEMPPAYIYRLESSPRMISPYGVFVSYQVDCVVEIIPKDDLRYRFSWAMRRLFEYEPFHVVQTIFPYAYTFWVVGAHDKTPKRRHK